MGDDNDGDDDDDDDEQRWWLDEQWDLEENTEIWLCDGESNWLEFD